MKILITGGAGYLGGTLPWRLTAVYPKCKIVIVDNLMYNQGPLCPHLAMENVEFHNIDVDAIDEALLKDVDVIFPLAAWVGAPICATNTKEAWRVNAESVHNLVKKLSKDQRIIFPCTNSGYGIQTDGLCTEETPMNSISLYGKSKEVAEQAIMEHPKATSFRLATVYGLSYRNRIDLMVNYFCYLAATTNKIDVFEGDFLRNFVNVNDVLNTFVEAIELENTFGEVFNLGNDADNTTKYKLVEKVKQYHPSLEITYSDKEDPDKRNYNVSSEKLAKTTGLKPRYTLDSTIPILLNYFRNFPDSSTNEHKNIVKLMKNA